MRFHIQGQSYQFKALPLSLSTACGGQTDCIKGYKNQPVPRQLVGQSQIPRNLSPAYTNSCNYLSGLWLVSQHGQIRSAPQASRPKRGQSQTQPRALTDLKCKITGSDDRTDLSSPATDVPHRAMPATEKQAHVGCFHIRPIQWHVKNNWKVPQSLEKVIPSRSTITPTKTCPANLYRRVKKGGALT